jgi:CxxC motif-containing protein (DUF1111 family)
MRFVPAPLWGLRMVTRYLHDARATTLDQAVLARDRYKALDPKEKGKLLAFLNSL